MSKGSRNLAMEMYLLSMTCYVPLGGFSCAAIQAKTTYLSNSYKASLMVRSQNPFYLKLINPLSERYSMTMKVYPRVLRKRKTAMQVTSGEVRH